MAVDMTQCTDRTMFLVLFGFYVAWMMGIAVMAYHKLHGSNDYATHFVGKKDYGVIVMTLTNISIAHYFDLLLPLLFVVLLCHSHPCHF